MTFSKSLIPVFLFGLGACHEIKEIWISPSTGNGIIESIRHDGPSGRFFFTRKKGEMREYELTFGYIPESNATKKSIYMYDSEQRLVEKIEYGFPTQFKIPIDSLSKINKYYITEEDRTVLDKIATLGENPSYNYPYNNDWVPQKISYLFKLKHTRYFYEGDYRLTTDTIYNYNIQVEEREGKEVFINTTGYFYEPAIFFNFVLVKNKSGKIIKSESAKLKEGIPYN